MRKVMAGITALLLIQSALAETIITAQDYAVDSDVVLESAVREIKSAPRDTVNMVGDTVKFVSDETITAANGVKAIFKSNPIDKTETSAALEIASAWDSSNDIVFRSYKVSDKVGKELTGGAEVTPGTAVDVSGFFSGVEFKKGTSAFFRPEFNRLFVRQTQGNILSIEDMLAAQSSAARELMGKQVSIETKFVEVNQSTLNELGFKWTFDNFKGHDLHVMDAISVPAGQSLAGAGLRTTAGAIGSGVASDTLTFVRDGRLDWTLVVNALEQSDDADVLSAPSITTRDGSKATIMVGEDRVVAKGYEVKSSDSSLYTQNDLQKMLMGVQLDVTPKIRADKMIDLDLKPKVVDLVGYDPYQSTPANAQIIPTQGNSLNGNASPANYIGSWLPLSWLPSGLNPVNLSSPIAIPLAPLTAKIPYYRWREINTQVTVEDGSTVAMGGLIFDKLETYKDKVPVLGSIPLIGRLFRSEGEKSVKRNLMIFVTATQVDVTGRKASDLALNK